MNQKTKQLLIIVGVIFVLAFVILSIVALTSNKQKGATKEEVAGTTEVDPVSGEKIATNSKQSQTGAGSADSERPTMLGFGKLTDYGVSAGQREKVKEQLTAFAQKQDPKITIYSFYKDSYRQLLPDDNGIAHMSFMVQANKKTDYWVDIAYSGTSDATISVYKSDKTTLLFTE